MTKESLFFFKKKANVVTVPYYSHVNFNTEFTLQMVKESSEQKDICHIFSPTFVSVGIQWTLT